LTCLMTLDWRRVKSMCSFMNRRMSSNESTYKVAQVAHWYTNQNTIQPAIPATVPLLHPVGHWQGPHRQASS
jgi:hypothetical protein